VEMLRKTRHRGTFKVGWVFTFATAGYNLVCMRNLLSLDWSVQEQFECGPGPHVYSRAA